MPPSGKKQLSPPPDVLSNLHKNLIDDILMRLPLKDAVGTSILSKKWRYTWRRLPKVKFDRVLCMTTKDLISPTIGFTPILCYLSAFPIGPITKLTIDNLRLEEIEIKVCAISDEDYFKCVPQDVVEEIPASFSDMNLNYLRTVTFYDVTGADAEMQLIKVLLAKSPALVKMVIKPRRMEVMEILEVAFKMVKFSRASSEVEVVYDVD